MLINTEIICNHTPFTGHFYDTIYLVPFAWDSTEMRRVAFRSKFALDARGGQATS